MLSPGLCADDEVQNPLIHKHQVDASRGGGLISLLPEVSDVRAPAKVLL